MKIDYTKKVRYELMLGREATQRIREYPVAYLPIGCLERHGDHLPMGLDVIKAHGISCVVAQAIGGLVFPPHFYSGIHRLDDSTMQRFTREWGNLYTDNTAKDHLMEIVERLVSMNIKVLVLYSGHYPASQIDMIREIADEYNSKGKITIIPFTEIDCLEKGDHAGISETSLMLYLDRNLVDMTRIGEVNYRDHGWSELNTPEKATASKGETDIQSIIEYFNAKIKQSLRKILIIGHRGARGIEPENTIRSFKKALELCVDYIECDVHLTKDNQIVLMHDHTVERTTNGSGAVNTFTFDEIRELDAGKGEKIPTLQELLDLARGKVRLHIELKDESATESTIRLVEKNNMIDQVFLTSGNTQALKKVRELNPSISMEHIFGDPPPNAIDLALSVGAKRVSCHISHLTREFVQKAHENGIQVIAWPPNTPEESQKATECGVDLICTDRPDIVKAEYYVLT